MIWFGKSFINFGKSFIKSIKLVSTRTCSLARVRTELAIAKIASVRLGSGSLVQQLWLSIGVLL